jgi:tetratricopeptide (TPR) repeat protein
MKRGFLAVGLALGLALLFAPGEAGAQTGTARGKVLDDKGQPVEAAGVTLEFLGGVTRKYETKTNKKGEFTQVGVYPGGYKITVLKDGFTPSVIEHRINLGDPTYLPDFKLVTRAAAQAAAQDKGADEMRSTFKRGIDLTQAGKFDEAEAAFKEILVKNPSVPEVHYNLGFLYTQKKDWPAAEAAFLKAVEIKPNYGEAYVALAKAYQDSGQAAKAMEVMSKAAASNQEDPKVQFNLGVFHLNSGKTEEAAAAFQKAATLDPGNAEVHYHLGTLAVGQNKIPDAIAHLEKYLSMSPTNAQNVATAQGLLAALAPKK